MFIAHLPAGYLASKIFSRRRKNARGLIATGLICSILPDFDLLWFYLIDQRQTPHREYMFHWPLFWLVIGACAWAVSWATGRVDMRPYIIVAMICLMVHMALDSFAAEIYWFEPLSHWHLNAINVPARYDWWVWNFVLHWTFAIELAIVLAACFVFGRSLRSDQRL